MAVYRDNTAALLLVCGPDKFPRYYGKARQENAKTGFAALVFSVLCVPSRETILPVTTI